MLRLLKRLVNAWVRRHAPAASTHPEDINRKPVAVITGGTEGIGRALAAEFARAGHNLLLVARGQEGLLKAAGELEADYSVKVYILPADLATPEGCEAVAAALEENGLYADILVNNAGIGLGGPFKDQRGEDILRLLDLNVRGLTGLMARFLPGMLRRGSGGILNVASLGGLLPGPHQAAYYASKAYVISLTEAVAHEIAGSGVRMCVVAPGPVATRFHAKMGAQHAFYLQFPFIRRPESVARTGFSGFMWRRTVIVPGLLPFFFSIAVRFVPHFLLVPFTGWLLKRRF